MKFTFSWLKKFLDTSLSLQEIVNALNSLGLEVEDVLDRSVQLQYFKIARIIEVLPHPKADKLQICKVDDGKQILQIVCGAKNVKKGLFVVLAPIGSVMPEEGNTIIETSIRGINSQGMLCSASELLVNNFNNEGIVELSSDFVLGDSFAKSYGLDDPVITLSITPNRADCLGVYGIARDLAAKNLGELIEVKAGEINFLNDLTYKIKVDIDSDLCPLFIGCQIREVKNMSSPRWLCNLLSNIGIEPISAIVDITNYVCHSFAQPMHAFDSDALGNKIVICKARQNEKLKALNNKVYSLDERDVIISNYTEVCLLGGIIGSKKSSCNLSTKNIFLEAAIYNKDLLLASAKRHKINTESKIRFERHVDSHARFEAFKIACTMIYEICGGKFYNLEHKGQPTALKKIEFDFSSLQEKTHLTLPRNKVLDILQKLGYELSSSEKSLETFIVPGWRDSEIKEDIIEEIVRIYGYDKIEQESLGFFDSFPKFPQSLNILKRLTSSLVSRGYHEVITWSFMQESKAEKFSSIKEELRVINPISNELNYMRSTIIPNLLDNIVRNQNNFIKNIKIFEIGPVFFGTKPEEEKNFLSAVSVGTTSLSVSHGGSLGSPHEKIRDLNIFDMKGDLENCLKGLGINFDSITITATKAPYYHPNISGNLVYKNNEEIGSFGSIHPKLLKDWGIENEIFYFELCIDKLHIQDVPGKFIHYTHPPILRDFAFIVDAEIKAGDIVFHIKNQSSLPIRDVSIFDIYVGSQIGPSKKSVAISVTLQTNTQLDSQEIDLICKEIISSVRENFKAELRG